MGEEARIELVDALRERYRVALREVKGRILDELVAVSGFHRKHAVRLLRSQSPLQPSPAVLGRRVYDEAVRQALIVIWEAADRICGKRLKVIIPSFLSAMERHGHLQLPPEVRQRLEAVSPATIDHMLRSVRKTAGSRRKKRMRAVNPMVPTPV